MNLHSAIHEPSGKTQSAFLISASLTEAFPWLQSLKGRRLSKFLSELLKDPLLDRKLSRLKSDKWKKQDQDAGLDLQPVYFYPDESDWAKLGMISSASGFSMCFIFVYLLLFYLGVLQLPNDKTILYPYQNPLRKISMCVVSLNQATRKLRRTLRQ